MKKTLLELSHIDRNGRLAQVDVGAKKATRRWARAIGVIAAKPETIHIISANKLFKGDVLGAAKIAGLLAAKKTPQLIPLCHSLPLDHVAISFELKANRILVTAEASCQGKTGVEMEALTAVSIACLTIYDMAKAADRNMVIGPIYLDAKKGGRSGHFKREPK
ncbi:MAG: cyclic pyranopterin monophosphate synthase MoaC [Elusimicrobia bacterium]|nr:cyclic pyranopterin monophosphate synthase MoaC [Elusimicrobiota bacterium]